MATRQDENKDAKKDGRKWSFEKKENGEVHTLHAHNRSPVHAHRMAVTLGALYPWNPQRIQPR